MLKSSSRKKQATAVVAELINMSLADLRAEWQERYGPPPKHRAADLLRRVLAWRIQAEAFGDLDAATRRILAKEQNVLRPAAQPGMRLAREWAGAATRWSSSKAAWSLRGRPLEASQKLRDT